MGAKRNVTPIWYFVNEGKNPPKRHSFSFREGVGRVFPFSLHVGSSRGVLLSSSYSLSERETNNYIRLKRTSKGAK